MKSETEELAPKTGKSRRPAGVGPSSVAGGPSSGVNGGEEISKPKRRGRKCGRPGKETRGRKRKAEAAMPPAEKSKNGQADVRSVYRAERIPPEIAAMMRELIIQGATAEEAARLINQDPELPVDISPLAAREFAKRDRFLPADRAKWITEVVESIGERMGIPRGQEEEEKSPEDRYVSAVIMTGVMHLYEADDQPTINQALLRRQQRENASHQHQMIVARRRMFAAQAKSCQQETKLMSAREKFINAQTVELRQAVHKFEKKRSVTPDTIREIRETYGLISDTVQTLVATPITVARQLPPAPDDALDAEIVDETTGRLLDPQAELERQNLARVRQGVASGMWQVACEENPVASGEGHVAVGETSGGGPPDDGQAFNTEPPSREEE